MNFAERARREVDRGGLEVSWWRYRRVAERVFKADMVEILSLVEGEQSSIPLFMRALGEVGSGKAGTTLLANLRSST